MAKTKKLKLVKLTLPRSEAEVNEYITTLAEAAQAAKKVMAKANQKIQAVKTALAVELSDYEAVIEQYSIALFTYFEKHRDELTDGGKRQSAAYATGTIGQRWTPLRTQIKNEETALRFAIAHQMHELYQEKTVLRRDAMLVNQALASTIPGVKFVRDRVVYIHYEEFDLVVELKKKVEQAA